MWTWCPTPWWRGDGRGCGLGAPPHGGGGIGKQTPSIGGGVDLVLRSMVEGG